MCRINLNKCTEYCECCGKTSEEIIAQLEQMTFVDGKRSWEYHTQREDEDHFSDGGECLYCAECGEVLDDESFTSQYESRGECWGAPCSERISTGYTCSSCGHDETF